MKHDDWTRLLHDRLADHRTAVPDGVWDKIEAHLDVQQHRNRKRTWLYVASWLSAAAAVALLLVGVFYTDDAPNVTTAMSIRTSNDVNAATINDAEPVTASLLVGKRAQATMHGRYVCTATKADDIDEMSLASAAPTAADEPVELATPDVSTSAHNENVIANNAKRPATVPRAEQQWEPSAEKRTANKHSEWSVGAYAGNVMAQSSSMTAGLPALAYKASSAAPTGSSSIDNTPVLFANYKETKHHSQPVSLGVSLAYAVSRRLALRSGLVYTRVTSDFIHSIGSDAVADHQVLHYLGVPLAVGYEVWGNRYVRTYATIGAQLDFNVKATLTTKDEENDITKDRPQFSGNAAVGIECRILPQLGIYAEPGVRYYFNNHSTVENVFKAQPWAFNVQMGVRINVK